MPPPCRRLLSRLAPGGLFYFTLNFDGATILEPPIDPDLDALIEALYHRTMDTRHCRGRPSGSSRTGRRLFGRLKEAGARLIAAGSSDWVVFPGPDGYPGDEAYFLHFIIDTIGQALHGHPELARQPLSGLDRPTPPPDRSPRTDLYRPPTGFSGLYLRKEAINYQ